jgi:ubiquinone/menaquinone biosynthesis C-methylase UbiE
MPLTVPGRGTWRWPIGGYGKSAIGRSPLCPMNDLLSESARVEEARIRAVYAKRQADARYSWFSPGYLFMVQERERRVLALLKRYACSPLAGKRMLEIGCGTGYWLREFIKWGARPENITGVDLIPDRVAEARRLCPGAVRVECSSAAKLLFVDATFDLVLQSTVFTSVLDPAMKQQIASEMLRVVKGDGFILWYDYHVNNPWNPDVRAVKKQEIYQLFPSCGIELRRITLAPPLARWLAPHSRGLASLLEKIPWLCTHYLGVIRKPR